MRREMLDVLDKLASASREEGAPIEGPDSTGTGTGTGLGTGVWTWQAEDIESLKNGSDVRAYQSNSLNAPLSTHPRRTAERHVCLFTQHKGRYERIATDSLRPDEKATCMATAQGKLLNIQWLLARRMFAMTTYIDWCRINKQDHLIPLVVRMFLEHDAKCIR